jgi:acetyl/propionyl-CoA carboxylase alpha subunit/acetyl-CoA carboxylase carboxyltransferase component
MKRLLIANRGEIAIRIARSAQSEGLITIGVAPQDDHDALHASTVDELITLPGDGLDAYLDIPAVVAAARTSGADAIHPGYGLLSEKGAFAKAVEDAGLIFVGPRPDTLDQLGDKVAAVALARAEHVPVLTLRADVTAATSARALFDELGDDEALILKALSGGGGRGVRIVRNEQDLASALKRASSEAGKAFGDPRIYAERFLDRARHVEIQVIGDGTGAVSHLWDRDCSLQRRHQKLLEIAPSPGLSDTLRRRLCDAAVRMAKAVRYRGVGTFEFLIDPNDETFYFIEANARLQVEHTVTEAVLGLDLVKAQLAIADGQTLADIGLDQSAIPVPNGYAIQARINLETLRRDGLVAPASGTISAYTPPDAEGLRTDGAGYAGYTLNPHYDSLLAKLIAHAPGGNFIDALERLEVGLEAFELAGVASTLDLQRRLIRDPNVVAYQVHTRFIDEHLDTLVPEDAPAIEDPLAVLEARPGRVPAPDLSGDTLVDQTALPDGQTGLPAPLPGTLVSLEVAPGDLVWIGRTVAILESMKMEHEVQATLSGRVVACPVAPGSTVLEAQRLIILAPEDVADPRADQATEIDLDHIRPDLAEARFRWESGHDERRPEAVAKRHGRGFRTARENIADLCDAGSFVEYGATVLAAQRKRRGMDDLIANTTGDGMVCGLGHVNGDLFPDERSRVMAMSYDYMVLAGTQGALNHYKKDRMFELARTQRLPTILFAEGGGGRPGDTDVTGVAGLDCLAFNYFAQLSGLVPTIGIVNGRCFAGNAVLLGCCDVIIATKSANIGIGGPAMIEGGGLGVFTPEEVGPIDVQVPNGVVDIAVEDEADAVARAKQYLSYFQGPVSDWQAGDQRALRTIVPENRLRWYDMRQVIEGLADTDSVLELREAFGVGIITALIRVEGRPMGLIANNPGHLSGAIDAPAADKAARFLQLCDAFDLPVLSLVDCPGIMVGPEIEKTALVRHASRLMVVGANITTPLITVIIRKGYGLGAQAMAGGSFRTPLMTVSWPTGEFGGMGLEGSVKLGFRKELEAIEDLGDRKAAFDERVARAYERGKAINMASHFEIDDVIDPAETRHRISAVLRSLPETPHRPTKKQPFIDTW